MNSPLPKVLRRVGGRTLVDRVIEVLEGAGVGRIIVVVGFGREGVEAEITGHHPDVAIAVQEEQLGTGHAVRMAMPLVPGDASTVGIFSGDTPLMTPEVVWALAGEHHARDAAVTMLTAELEDPTGYGRIVRSEDGLVVRIVEERDADPQTRAIREINAGAYIFERSALVSSLEQIGIDNVQGEYYLTETVDILHGEGRPVAAYVAADDPAVVLGVNTAQQLMEAEFLLKEREG